MTDEELQGLLVLDDAPGPALAIDAAHAAAIVDAALAGAGFGPGGGPGGGASGTARASGGSSAATIKLAIVAGAALVVVAIALLAGRSTHRPPVQLATPTVDAPSEAGGGASAQPAGAPAAATAEEPTSTDPPIVEMSGDEPPIIGPSPPDREPPDRAPSDRAAPDRSTRDRSSSDPPGRAKPARPEPDPAEAAADLLGEANAKRAAKQWRDSDALYARVVHLAPKSLAAQTALVASATLHLEHLADPKGAAQRFRRALAIAPAGALAEDARWGLAEAARASHDSAGEAAALDDFLAHHGGSPLAQRAKARRAELP